MRANIESDIKDRNVHRQGDDEMEDSDKIYAAISTQVKQTRSLTIL
jgi:hypothetical protein